MSTLRSPLAPDRLARIAIEERGAIQRPSELSALLELLAADPPRRLLEIGTYQGGTLWAFAQQATADAVIISIDLPQGEFGGSSTNGHRHLQNFGRGKQKLVELAADSHDPASVAQTRAALEGEPLDFLFIDGDHTYRGVSKDFELYWPLVRPGGIAAFHDIQPYNNDPRCQVDKLWQELRGQCTSREIIFPMERLEIGLIAGIGVLWKPTEPR